MDRFDTPNKIICLIEMAFKGEITWLNFDLLIDGLTPNLGTSRQIIRILLKEFESHQSKCVMNTSKNAKSISDDVIEIDQVKTILESNQEEIIQAVEEKKSAEQVTNIEGEDDFSNISEPDKSDYVSSEAGSIDEEFKDENNVSKNIRLVEEFKGQFYTFIGENSEEGSEESLADCQIQSLDNDVGYNQIKYREKCFKTTKHVTSRKTFECETCGKCFRSNYDLKVHVSTHTGEKPYICKICIKGFAQPCDLKRHERMHTGEKPYICKTCKKGFADSSALKRHERSHTGEKPFQCKTCNKSFAQSHLLTRHQKVHTM